MIVALAIKSLRHRRLAAALTVASIALSVALLLGVERLREDSRQTFASAASGIDLIVGARTSPVHLLLASLFRIGNATSNLSWNTYAAIAARPGVAWAIPVSLGDSHRGFPVLGTTSDYFDHFHFGEGRSLEFAQGGRFADASGAVLGADVAAALGYRIGDEIVIAHGSGEVAFALHHDHPFRVAGILARTGTPVDRAIHVSLEGMDAVHAKAQHAGDDPLAAALRDAKRREAGAAGRSDADRDRNQDHDHGPGGHDAGAPPERSVTAILVGLRSRGSVLSVQRALNEWKEEPLTAILPGVAMLEVWDIVAGAEKTLVAIAALVVVMGLAGMLIALLTSLSERRREMAVLRAVGARPRHVFALLLGEAALLTVSGIALGVALLYGALAVGRPWLEQHLGLFIPLRWPSAAEFELMMLVAASGVLTGWVPAYRIYRQSLADGMTVRI